MPRTCPNCGAPLQYPEPGLARCERIIDCGYRRFRGVVIYEGNFQP